VRNRTDQNPVSHKRRDFLYYPDDNQCDISRQNTGLSGILTPKKWTFLKMSILAIARETFGKKREKRTCDLNAHKRVFLPKKAVTDPKNRPS
jgi:hypothetical protein